MGGLRHAKLNFLQIAIESEIGLHFAVRTVAQKMYNANIDPMSGEETSKKLKAAEVSKKKH